MDELYLGTGRVVITPKLGVQLYGYRPPFRAERVEDDLTVTAFYFKQGDKQAVMVSATVCLIDTNLAARIRAQIEENFGIPANNCFISATHTHCGPNVKGALGWGDPNEDYVDGVFQPKILEAIEQAMANPVAVTVGTASGDSYVGINRCQLLQDNTLLLGQNPWGAFNPRMTVVAFKNEEGKVVGNLIHYGCHCTAAGRNASITRDWAGIMTDGLEAYTGAITAFLNGPEGDIGPRISNGKTIGGYNEGENGIQFVREAGYRAAQDAVSIYKEIYDYHDVEFLADGALIDVPVKKRIPLEEAKAIYEEYKDATEGFASTMRTYALEVIATYEKGMQDAENAQIQQTVLALGNLVFVSFPYELFSEIGMRIDERFKDKRILSLSNTNGSEGYFITEDAICRGGYEVAMFKYGQPQPYQDNADFALMQNTVNHIKKVLY